MAPGSFLFNSTKKKKKKKIKFSIFLKTVSREVTTVMDERRVAVGGERKEEDCLAPRPLPHPSLMMLPQDMHNDNKPGPSLLRFPPLTRPLMRSL